jgi:DNA-binding GntR family transcriptional regulator
MRIDPAAPGRSRARGSVQAHGTTTAVRASAQPGRTGSRKKAPPGAASGGSLADKAYAEMKRMLITLALRPGQFMNEAWICAELGIGRSPVHQALHRLQLEGLIEIIPRKGILVRSESLNDVLALLDARIVVEPHCIALAAERGPAALVEQLSDLLHRSAAAAKQGDREAFMALDVEFHSELANGAGNPVLADIMRLLHQRASRIWHLQVWSSDDLLVTQQEHRKIYEAVRRHRPEQARSAAQRHLASLRQRILKGAG